MAVKIQVRRGSRAGLPALAPGEYGLTTDTKELFIGGPDGNLQVPVLGSDGKVPAGQLPDMNYDPAGTAATEAGKVQANLTSHTNNKSNPHSVTKAQVGLGNVDNTSDANKPISTATQTALNGKQATVTGGASTITSSNLTANRALVSNGSGKVAVSAVTSTELGYLDGVTSNIQTQINAKASTSYVDGLVGDINSALDAINGEVI